MTITPLHSIIIILVAALATFATRLLPFVLFGRGRELPAPARFLGELLPGAIIAALVVFCLKDISFASPGEVLPELICVALVAALQIWKRNVLLSIAAGTLFYMFLIQIVF